MNGNNKDLRDQNETYGVDRGNLRELNSSSVHVLRIMTGFPAFYEREIPWVFHDIFLRKFQTSMRNTFSLRCVIVFTKATVTSQSMNTHGHMDTRRTYPNLTKTFPFWVTVTNSRSFLRFLVVFPYSLSFHRLENFQGFPWFPEWLRTLLWVPEYSEYMSKGETLPGWQDFLSLPSTMPSTHLHWNLSRVERQICSHPPLSTWQDSAVFSGKAQGGDIIIKDRGTQRIEHSSTE